MFSRLRNFFQLPTSDDPIESARLFAFYRILLSIFLLTFLYFLYSIFNPPFSQLVIASIALFMEGMIFLLSRSRRGLQARILLSISIWFAIFLSVFIVGGIQDTGFAAFTIVIIIAEVILGNWAGAVFTFAAIVAGVILIILENSGVTPPPSPSSYSSTLLSHSITFVAAYFLVALVVRRIMVDTKAFALIQDISNDLRRKLENYEMKLSESATQLEWRNKELLIINMVHSIYKPGNKEVEFLANIATEISMVLGYDIVDIFLLSEKGEEALLCASNKNNTAERTIKVIKDPSQVRGIRADEIHKLTLGNSQLFYIPPPIVAGAKDSTVSPLIANNHLLGFISATSLNKNLMESDKDILEGLARQTAYYLVNSRMAIALLNNDKELQALSSNHVQNAWVDLEKGKHIGYEYDRIRMIDGLQHLPPDLIRQLNSRKSITYITQGESPRARLVSPIIIRDQVFGLIGYEENDPSHIWEEDRILLLETVASQVGMALENTRLLTEAQLRAQNERTLTEVSSSIRATLNVDTIIQTAIRELQFRLDLSQAEIHLVNQTPVRLMPISDKEIDQ